MVRFVIRVCIILNKVWFVIRVDVILKMLRFVRCRYRIEYGKVRDKI